MNHLRDISIGNWPTRSRCRRKCDPSWMVCVATSFPETRQISVKISVNFPGPVVFTVGIKPAGTMLYSSTATTRLSMM